MVTGNLWLFTAFTGVFFLKIIFIDDICTAKMIMAIWKGIRPGFP